MKTKSPCRPLTGAALKSRLKEHDADVKAIKQADTLVDAVKRRIIHSKEGIAVSDLPGEPRVMQWAFRKLVDYILCIKETEGYELTNEKELRIALVRKHSLEMAEATATINALKAALAVLLK